MLAYKDDLGNPPLLIVSDIDRIEIRTNFTSLSPVRTTITLDDLAADDPSQALMTLRDVFIAPEECRPRVEQSDSLRLRFVPLDHGSAERLGVVAARRRTNAALNSLPGVESRYES